MKKRNEINDEYKWDQESKYENPAEIEKILTRIELITKELPKYKDKLNEKNMLYERLTRFRQDYIELDGLMAYIYNSINVNKSDHNMLKVQQKMEFVLSKFNEANSYFTPQLHELPDDYLHELVADIHFKDFDMMFKDILKNKPHKISENDNKLLAKISKCMGNESEIHSIMLNSEVKFDDAVDSKGKKHSVNNQSINKLLKNKDRILRKSAFESRYKSFKMFNKTLTELYLGSVKYDTFYTKLTKFDSTLEKSLFDDDISPEVFSMLLSKTIESIGLNQKFMSYLKKKSKLTDFSYYDSFAHEANNKKIDLGKAKEIILKAMAPLGENYVNRLNKKMSDHTIDYYPNIDKQAGAYSLSTYQSKSMILMNYIDDYYSVSTIAHELGHSINSDLINENQPFEKSGITPFMAEIASTVNELFLVQYMIENSTQKESSIYIEEFLSDVRGTIFRQVMFSEFEHYIHTMIETEQAISYKEVNEYYYGLLKKYYGNSLILPKYMECEWSIVPHFYNAYYVFSYATGLISAIAIVQKIKQDGKFVDKYLEFLKTGTAASPMENLSKLGIDLTSEEPYNLAFKYINDILSKLK